MDTKPVDLEAVERRFDGVDDSDSTGAWMEAVVEVLDDVEPLVAEVRRLREALAPFAAIADRIDKAGVAAVFSPAAEFRVCFANGEVMLRLSDCKRAKEVLP